MKVDNTGRGRAVSARARDAAIRRTRMIIAGVAAGAVALSGLFSVVAAQAFKGHQQGSATVTPAENAPTPTPAPPSAGADPTPLQPPAQPPAASPTPDATPAPQPQVSGGS
jgi:hypothetical protein